MGDILKTLDKLDPLHLGTAFGIVDAPPVEATPAPTVAPVTPMPEPDDAQVKKARRRSLVAQRQRSGRASTILSDDTDSLGG